MMKKKILVIEDNEDNMRIVRDLLTSANYEVIEAVTGQDGVTAAETQGPELIIMDIQLPDFDGYEATREIRKLEKQSGGHIPVIAMTAYATEGDRERCLAAGMDDYVSKPISASKLFKAIEALMAPEESAPSTDEQKGDALNDGNLIKSFENDHSLLKELVEIFISDYPQMLTTLRKSLETTDAKTFSRTAHSLKPHPVDHVHQYDGVVDHHTDKDDDSYPGHGIEDRTCEV